MEIKQEHRGSARNDKALTVATTSGAPEGSSTSSSASGTHGGGPLGNTKLGDALGSKEAALSSKSTRAHNWLFTWHVSIGGSKYLDGRKGLQVGKEDPFPKWDETKMRRLKFSLEAGEDGGKLHYQGYISCLRAVTWSSIQKWTGMAGAHFIKINVENKNWVTHNENYTAKPETHIQGPWCYGVIPNPGARSDLVKIKDEVKAGTFNEAKFADENPLMWAQYGKRIKTLQTLIGPKSVGRSEPTWGIGMFGPSGTSKSWTAKKAYPNAFFITSLQKGWYDGYEGQDVVVLDEFHYTDPAKRWCTEAQFNSLFGDLDIQVPVKGGFVKWKPKKIVVTTNDNFLDWPTTMQRRINEYIPMLKRYEGVKDNLEKNLALARAAEQYMKNPYEDETSLESIANMESYVLDDGDSKVAAEESSPAAEPTKGEDLKRQPGIAPEGKKSYLYEFHDALDENIKLKNEINSMKEQMKDMEKIMKDLYAAMKANVKQ